jgi:hypothetical protein
MQIFMDPEKVGDATTLSEPVRCSSSSTIDRAADSSTAFIAGAPRRNRAAVQGRHQAVEAHCNAGRKME